jgi:hypothetical protein
MREISNHLQWSPHLLHVPPTHQRPSMSLTIAWSSERRCENGPEPTALRNLFFGVGFPASSPEHHSTLAALGTIFKRSSFQPCRKAVTRQSMSSQRFDFTRNGLKLWPGPAADFAPSVRHFSHASTAGKVADSGLWTMLRMRAFTVIGVNCMLSLATAIDASTGMFCEVLLAACW